MVFSKNIFDNGAYGVLLHSYPTSTRGKMQDAMENKS